MPGYKNVGGPNFTGNGIGKKELQNRMKQHTALRDKALRKRNEADKMYKGMAKLIGQHGSDPAFKKAGYTDAAYKTMDKAFVTRQSAYKQAVKFNKGLKKLQLDK